ncbi:MAG: hypothetical protein ABFD90_16230 [Phycisphaerales bacterium]
MNASLVNEQDFHRLVEKRADMLLALADYLSRCENPRTVLTRPLLGEFLSQSMQFEELLDTYDAGKNCLWCNLRSLTATIKLFSDASYELMHIQHRASSYRLMPVERDFVAATEEALAYASGILAQTSKEILNRSRERDLKIPQKPEIADAYEEHQLPGRLAHNCGARQTDTVAGTVALLATAFLNLASESEDVRAASRARPEEYATRVSGSLSEERLRSLEFQFHNLQSQYDTYVSGTQAESVDKDLPVLRGHVSVVFHLLRIGTLFAHYYERHMNKQHCVHPPHTASLVEPGPLLSVLMNYSVTFIDLYIGRAVSLCQEMLKRYAEVGRVDVSIPKYRGFHVRPSTLISKLVLHYGSRVQMLLGDEVYDASSSLDLFRANEKINAQKRRWLAKEIVRLGLVPENSESEDAIAVVRAVVLSLAEKSKLVMYEQPLELPERICGSEGTLLERVTSETGRLLAMGKIDISIDMNAQFVGDKRVLADIQILAEHGYGEDNFGNNVPLPKQLAYLRR